jgi:hypothetical protein
MFITVLISQFCPLNTCLLTSEIFLCFSVSFGHLLPELHRADAVLLWRHAVGCDETRLAVAEVNGNNCV